MKWSDLIKNLESNINEYGDKDIKFCEIITDSMDLEITTNSQILDKSIVSHELKRMIVNIHELRDDGESWKEDEYVKYYSDSIYNKTIYNKYYKSED